MKKRQDTTEFVCANCDYRSRKWFGKCPGCGEWESLVEKTEINGSMLVSVQEKPQSLLEAPDGDEERFTTATGELDRVLGGGIVPGSVVLIGGDPGIGKSTLMMQALGAIAGAGKQVLYTSGEESARQIKMRAKRLCCLEEQVFLATVSSVEKIVAMAGELRPALLVVDSIQTLTCADFPSAPGSVTQVRETAARLSQFAKMENIPVILIGHVTKEGTLAGPRVLEHMVDTVLYFEGDRSHAYRILRTVKNRFGSTNEIGVFEMKESGLAEVDNPSQIFLAERPLDVAGSVVIPSVEGTRPILVEVQALVSPTNLGTARRTALGADPHRLALLCAVLEKKAGMDLYGHDIFLNIAGGIRIDEPALDLGVICALASSLLDRSIASTAVLCGEVGLAGEVRAASQIELRVGEAERLGFQKFVMPKGNLDRITIPSSMDLIGVATIQELLDVVFREVE